MKTMTLTMTSSARSLFRLFGVCCVFISSPLALAATETTTALSLPEFIKQAAQNDTTFETILIDQLALQHRRDALLPDSDLIMDLKYQYNFYLDQDRNNPQASLSLSKLFPYNGTEVSLSYGKSSSVFSNSEDASLELLISQPIGSNAFGTATRLQDKIIGIENEVSRYQIVEAYEDYLASLTAVYYNWYSAYENLKVGQLSVQSNRKLMDNILERQAQKIALPIDVNKMKLLLIGKQENVIVLQEVYDTYANLIAKAINQKEHFAYTPVKPAQPASGIQFKPDYASFIESSRTYRILQLLEQQGNLEVTKVADDLLPSTSLLLGYALQGQDWDIQQQQDNLFAGISVSWPIGRSVTKAKKQLAQIAHKKTVLSNQNKYAELGINLKNLFLQIQREQKLITIAASKISLAEAVLQDEAENYSFGKVSLNDYITAVNRVDENRFSYTEHSVQLNKLLIEWLRLTDQLVDENVLTAKSN